ncbi:MAG: hypothetical protein H6704_11420 [Myxococcales bacterium]|nr:hypothetical protein [Myxococcales bacterium]
MRISKGWLVFAGGVLAAGAVILGHRTSSYLHDEPNLCTSCHADTAADGLTLLHGAAPSHPDTTCQACHPIATSTGLSLLRASVTIDRADQVLGENVAAHGEAPAQACLDCHQQTDPDWARIADTGGHQSHLEAKEPLGCNDCHAATGHEGRPGNALCKDCHDDQTMASSPMAQLHCMECHDFLAPAAESGKRPRFARCDRCHGPGERATSIPVQLHAEMPCSVCHQPHREPFTVAQGCEDCHPKVIHAHPEVEDTVYCTTCHGPHDEWSVAATRCAGCHEEQVFEALPGGGASLAHDDDLLTAVAEVTAHATCIDCHSAHAKPGVMVAKVCTDCHDDVQPPSRHTAASCDGCHAPHRPQPEDCDSCHDTVRVRHASAGCQDCHAMHETFAGGRDVRTCVNCHREPDVRAGHPESRCEDCHKPHRPQPKTCDACHQAEVRAVAGTPADHRQCTSCHPVHAQLPKPALLAKCRDCHDEVRTQTAKIAEHQDCSACHATHTVKAAMPGGCTECHADHLRHTVPDHRQCGECHRPHDGGRGGKKDCADCHAEKARPAQALPQHTDCDRCHQVHPQAAPKTPDCTTCHKANGEAAQPLALHRMEGHETCGECHTAHGPFDASRKNCLRCHEAQQNHEPQAPVCNGCHRFIDE